MAAQSGHLATDLLDFSVNVCPDGPPDFLLQSMNKALKQVAAYPSPHADEALEAAASYHGIPEEHFVFGNGSNEVIHALARVLKKKQTPCVYIVEPAFSEYGLACSLAGLELCHVMSTLFLPDASTPLGDMVKTAPSGAAVFLANPGNPSGLYLAREVCLDLMAQRPDLLWIVDEAFIDYVAQDRVVSLIGHMPENGLVLRSLTKFYAVPGLRVGYAVASREMAQAIRQEMPFWNLNCLAIAAAVAVFEDQSDFANQTRATNAMRRTDLATQLASLPELELLPSQANYILFRYQNAPSDLYTRLLSQHGIAIRDCSNYYGLTDGTWFRVAVRFPAEHTRLVQALQTVMKQ